MRITGGELRGRHIRVPKDGVRPSQDRMREALFSMLASRIRGARFLDLYAGSGAVGIEAWSRGAARVCWVEANPRVLSVLRENAALCPEGCRVISGPALRIVQRGLQEQFDIVFADPPYKKGEPAERRQRTRPGEEAGTPALLEAIRGGAILAPDGLVIVEDFARNPAEPSPGWSLVDERVYGETRLQFYRPESTEAKQKEEAVHAKGDLRGNV